MTAPELGSYFDRLFAEAGYERIEPPILQDADIFLDLAGEELRRRLFLTPSADGVELCLRPDYTIPVCLHHLTTGDPKRPANYAYFGPVFRQRPGETGEFLQAGVESIGRTDLAAAEADVLDLALTALGGRGVDAVVVKIGDSALFAALLEALAIPDVWRRRLARAFGDRRRLDALRARLGDGERRDLPSHTGFLAALDGSDHQAAHRVVEDLLSLSGIRPVGGRSVGEIADRFLEQAMLAAAAVDDRVTEVLDRFLAIGGTSVESITELKLLATDEKLSLGPAIDNFDRRAEAFARRGVDASRLRFAADFGRRLDYYTGFVFEVYAAEDASPVVGGGRYDRLLSLIVNRDGSGSDIPAVGFALWTERLPESAA